MENIRLLRTEADYDWALSKVGSYFENPPPPGTSGADRFDLLATMIEAYEAKHWPVEPADPIKRAAFRPL